MDQDAVEDADKDVDVHADVTSDVIVVVSVDAFCRHPHLWRCLHVMCCF